MTLTCLFIDIGTMLADLHGLATVSLRRSYEFDAAVAVPVVVPVHK